jgi:3-hydroxybutyryl-CoA dehydrogenase
MPVDKMAVLGAGAMGRGIAECAASSGMQVLVIDPIAGAREQARQHILSSVTKAIQRGKSTAASPDEVLNRIQWSDSLDLCFDVQFVIEAASEQEAVKSQLFRNLDSICVPSVILASNTSSISITRLAAVTRRPEQVVGMHFFNPVPIMAPVEIVRGQQTSDATITATHDLAKRLGKQSFCVSDRPGFVVNRILMPLINEAAFTLQEEVADAKTIDSLMKLGCNHPMGPLELADLIGLDVCLAIIQVLHRDLANSKFQPCPLLMELVAAGKLGRKTGSGFYDYQKQN